MEKTTKHPHPRNWFYRIQQVTLLVSLLVMVIASVALVVIALILPAPLFIVMAVLLLLLALPLLLMQTTTPPVTITEEGCYLHPFIGAERLIRWEDVLEIRAYPLLPAPHQESGRKLLVGREKYQAAEGIMLIVRGLPPQYRIAGFLAGAQSAPVVAFTNRTHTAYPQLVQRIRQFAPHAVSSLAD